MAFHEAAMTPPATLTPAGHGMPMTGMKIMKGTINFNQNHLATIQDREKKLLRRPGVHLTLVADDLLAFPFSTPSPLGCLKRSMS